MSGERPSKAGLPLPRQQSVGTAPRLVRLLAWGAHETTRIHHGSRHRGGIAARCAGAAARPDSAPLSCWQGSPRTTPRPGLDCAFGSASCCTRSGLLLALSWPNLPCALKAAIGIGKRTLAILASHSALSPNSLMIGHHFSASAFWKPARVSGVCRSRGTVS